MDRDQLWHGLLLRAKNPDKFNPSLSCRTEDISDTEFKRYITVGDSEFSEQVKLDPYHFIHTLTLDSKPFHAESTATIEEPETGSLFVRFQYKRELEEQENQVNIGEHLKSAYLQIDRDAITLIRTLVERESVNQSIN